VTHVLAFLLLVVVGLQGEVVGHVLLQNLEVVVFDEALSIPLLTPGVNVIKNFAVVIYEFL
jgi:hypothetical protein